MRIAAIEEDDYCGQLFRLNKMETKLLKKTIVFLNVQILKMETHNIKPWAPQIEKL